MKIVLQLNVTDEADYLNFWDARHGEDVICKIVGDQLLLIEYDGEMRTETPITLAEWVRQLKENSK